MIGSRALARIANIEDLARLARRRVPRIAIDYVDGAAGGELAMRRNRQALDAVTLTPRYLADVSARTAETELFGERHALPIGVAPVGLANVVWPGLDLILARAARDAGVPYILSTVGTTGLEEVAAAAAGHLWFQLYVSQREEVTFDLMRRADAAGVSTLVVTVDVPAGGRRDREIRNGFQLPLRPTPALLANLLLHPAWLWALARNGPPTFHNLAAYAGSGRAPSIATYAATHVTDRLDAAMLARIRDAWPGKLVIKGIMDPGAAQICAGIGADGIIVSNHGGRQFEASPATIEVLPAIHAAVGDRVAVMLDGGVRSGVDVLRAFALGAQFVFAGRSFVYGAAAAGPAGAAHAFAIFRDDILRGLAQLGVNRVADLPRRGIAEPDRATPVQSSPTTGAATSKYSDPGTASLTSSPAC